MKQSNKKHTLRNAEKWLGHLCTFDGKADDHSFFQEYKRIRSEFLSHMYRLNILVSISLQEVAILKETMFRKAELWEKSKNNKIKTRRDPISFALCFQLRRSLDVDSNCE